MAKKCPPGVFCIENMTIVFMLIFVVVLGVIVINTINAKSNNQSQPPGNVLVVERSNDGYFSKPASIFSTLKSNLFMNPMMPPLKQNPFFNSSTATLMGDVRGGIPINTPTSHYDLDYKQVGILTRESGRETILPIFGRPLHSNRNKWQYYTMTDKNNMVRLPLSKGGRSCTNEYGCDEIFSGDNVYVEGYKDSFGATIYENDTPRYIPVL